MSSWADAWNFVTLAYITRSRPLEDGDIVNIDITVYLNGYHGDTSRTFLFGNVVSNFLYSGVNVPHRSFRMRGGATWSTRPAKPLKLESLFVGLETLSSLLGRPYTT